MVKLINISKDFYVKENQSSFTLGKIDLSFPDKGLISIVGRSGSGKTTLLNIIGGIITPDTGKVFYEDLDSDALTSSQYDFIRNRYIGFIFQDFYLIEKLTVFENIKIALDLQNYSETKINEKIEFALGKLDISHLKDRNISELSGGEKQRVSIARVLAKGCHVILADEPTGALDEATAKSVLEILKTLSQSILIILVTHDKEYAFNFSDRVITLRNGKITKDEKLKDLSDYSPKKLQIISEKLKFKNIWSLSNKVLTKKIKKFVFAILFWIVSSVLLMVSVNLALLNNQDFVYESLQENNTTHFKVVNKSFLEGGPLGRIDIDSFDQSQFPTMQFNVSYNTNYLFDYSSFQSNPYEMDGTLEFFYGQTVFNYIEIVDEIALSGENIIPLLDNEMVITDYIASNLIYRNILNSENVNGVKGQKIAIFGKEITIKDIIPTDYTFFLSEEMVEFYENSYPKFLNANEFLEKQKNEYKTVYMNNATLNFIDTNDAVFSVKREELIFNIYSLDHYVFEEAAYLGSIPSDNQEIMVDVIFLRTVLGEDVTTLENLGTFLNKNYEIEFYDQEHELRKETFEVVGIIYSSYGGMFVSNEEFLYLETHFAPKRVEDFIMGYSVTLGSNKDNLPFIEQILANDQFIYTYFSEDLLKGYNFIQDSKELFNYFSLFSLIFLVLVIYYFTSSFISDNKRIVGILSSLGCRKNDFTLIFIFENIKIFFISIFLSSILHVLIMNYLGNYVQQTINVNLNVLRYVFASVPLVVIVMVAISLLSSFIPINRLRKKDLVKIIYDI
ncbi:MAG: ATP-binding cassette domain-containing protein [Lutibacter sp.]|jgi:ABC-type lipoprotein export system ATPase subunit/ABC-type antimicrobial peptide transport system permease subunit